MNCNEATKLINAALDGELNAAEKQAVDQHLEKCPECRHIASHSTRLKSELQTPVAVPAQLKAAVRDHLFLPKSQPVIARKKPMNKLSTTKWGLTGLAAAALAIAAMVALTPRPADAKTVLKKMQTAAQKSPVINVVENDKVSGRSFNYEVLLVNGRPSDVKLVEGRPPATSGREITLSDGTIRLVRITDEKGKAIPSNKTNEAKYVEGFLFDVTKLDLPTAEGIAEALQIGGKGAAEPKLLGTEMVGGKEVQILCVEDKKKNQRALYWINSATGLPFNQRVEVKVDGKWIELKSRKFSYIEVRGFPLAPGK